jgi:aminoglycoside phosphotransferase (APT) family kinase protein
MSKTALEKAREVVAHFEISGDLEDIQPFPRGHIHNTLVSRWRQQGSVQRFLHQQLNEVVFRDIDGLMHNIERVTRHLQDHPSAAGLQTLQLVRTRTKRSYHRDSSGPWRTFHFLENTLSHDLCQGPEQAFRAAQAFGFFQAQLTDLDVRQLQETIPRFFHSPTRLAQLRSVQSEADHDRLQQAAAELEFVAAREGLVTVIEDALAAGKFPRRIVHGDTKLNNVLFDADSGQAVCVVDLDTCMPGYSLYDFGDLVRFTAATSKEDERDLSIVGMNLELYQALVQGYLSGAGVFLTETERRLMPLSARLVTLTIGLRFLADYLAGDRYFKIQRPEQNLDRARVQFALVQSMEQQDEAMQRARRSG